MGFQHNHHNRAGKRREINLEIIRFSRKKTKQLQYLNSKTISAWRP